MNVADQLNQAFVLSRSWTLSTTTLFPVRIARGPLPSFNKQQYAVSSDGQRFLINLAADEGAASPITLIYNWKPKP